MPINNGLTAATRQSSPGETCSTPGASCLGTIALPRGETINATWLVAAAVSVVFVAYRYRDGTPHIVMSPLEFMQRLAALVPRPRLHLIGFHGVLAPNARLRAAIVQG